MQKPLASARDPKEPLSTKRRVAPISRTTPLRDRVRDVVRQAIIDGRYRPGQRLTEERLAEDFQVSRNPVREALRGLATEGLVEITPWRGAVVVQLSRLEALELVEIRANLEGLNARHAARRRDPTLIRQLNEILREGSEVVHAGRTELLSTLNARFHETLYEAGHNRALLDIMRTLRVRTAFAFLPMSAARAQQTWEEHAAILRAIIAGDEQLAEILASRHVSNLTSL